MDELGPNKKSSAHGRGDVQGKRRHVERMGSIGGKDQTTFQLRCDARKLLLLVQFCFLQGQVRRGPRPEIPDLPAIVQWQCKSIRGLVYLLCQSPRYEGTRNRLTDMDINKGACRRHIILHVFLVLWRQHPQKLLRSSKGIISDQLGRFQAVYKYRNMKIGFDKLAEGNHRVTFSTRSPPSNTMHSSDVSRLTGAADPAGMGTSLTLYSHTFHNESFITIKLSSGGGRKEVWGEWEREHQP